MIEKFRKVFPNINTDNFKATSPMDTRYNCIAWAYDRNDIKLWPNCVDYKWVEGVPTPDHISSFIELYKTIGYNVCVDGLLEDTYEKICIYESNKKPTHAARQLPSGKWTSKLGNNIDVEHDELSLEGGYYGNISVYMKRKRIL